MNPNENEEVKKIKWRPAAFLLASLVAVTIAIAAFWGDNLPSNQRSTTADLSQKLAEERQVLHTEVMLHDRYSQIQQMDERYGNLVVGAGSSQAIENAEKAIQLAEQALRSSLDSIDKATTGYNAWANVVMLDSITTAFRKTLDNRRYMADIRRAVGGKPLNLTTDQRQMMQMQQELQRKNQAIATLEKQVKTRPAEKNTANAGNTQKTDELEAMLAQEEARSTSLLGINKSLKQDNEKLQSDLTLARRSAESQGAAMTTAKNRVQGLQNEITALEAELDFARVDCNLIRADGTQIISNSRQRKELLEEALKSLRAIASSDNETVQRKARAKMEKLNAIASMVRD